MQPISPTLKVSTIDKNYHRIYKQDICLRDEFIYTMPKKFSENVKQILWNGLFKSDKNGMFSCSYVI
jgi:hypothetical protein